MPHWHVRTPDSGETRCDAGTSTSRVSCATRSTSIDQVSDHCMVSAALARVTYGALATAQLLMHLGKLAVSVERVMQRHLECCRTGVFVGVLLASSAVEAGRAAGYWRRAPWWKAGP